MSRFDKVKEILHDGVVIPATPLALHADRSFNPEGQATLCRYYLDCGVGGIATAVHTTQFEIRKPEYNLYDTVLKIMADEIDAYEAKTGKIVVKVAGVCGKIPQAISEAKIAKSLGFDCVLLSPGGLSDLSEDEMIERTKAVAEIMPVIGFYLQPAAGGRIFSYNYWERLCACEGVVAIKCASFNRYQTLDVMRAAALSPRSKEIALYTGNDDNIVIDLLTPYKFVVDGKEYTSHFVGGLLGHWTVWTKKVVEMHAMLKEAAKKDTIPVELLTLATHVTDMNAALFDAANGFAGCVPGVHEVLVRQGLMEGTWCLNPDEKLSKGQPEELTRVCEYYPDLVDDAFIAAHLPEWR